jgi:peptidyl-prolyl cis-trans isomerase C
LPARAAEDTVVARVNGVDVKQSDLDFAASEVGPRLSNYQPADRRKVLLQYVIENELMAGAGEKDKLNEAPSFSDRVKYHQRRALRDAFFDSSIRNAVPEADAKKVYDEKIKEIKPEQEIRARHILVESEAEANSIRAEVTPENFAELARENSTDEGSAKQGGSLGPIQKGQLVPEFEKVAFSLEDGEISDPVKTQFGWHIIMVDITPASTTSFADAKSQIISSQLAQRRQDKFTTWSEGVLKKWDERTVYAADHLEPSTTQAEPAEAPETTTP